MRTAKRNTHPIDCTYCGTEKQAGEAEIWKHRNRWYGCCDGCKQTHPKQIEAAKKHKERQEAKKKPQPAQSDLLKELKKLKKDDLIQLLASVSE